jgi:outer membrane protein
MRKTFVAGLLLALGTTGGALAQEASPKAARVAVIDMARVSSESLLGKGYASQLEKLQNDINATAQKKQLELGQLDAALKSLQDELEKQGPVLSQDAREKKQQEIVKKTRERQAYLEDGQAEINRLRERAQQQAQSINQEFQTKVRPIVEQVAKEQGYDLVVDSQVVYPVNQSFDITSAVVAKADAMAQAKPAPAASPTPSPKP